MHKHSTMQLTGYVIVCIIARCHGVRFPVTASHFTFFSFRFKFVVQLQSPSLLSSTWLQRWCYSWYWYSVPHSFNVVPAHVGDMYMVRLEAVSEKLWQTRMKNFTKYCLRIFILTLGFREEMCRMLPLWQGRMCKEQSLEKVFYTQRFRGG